jgi:hypothetical protein
LNHIAPEHARPEHTPFDNPPLLDQNGPRRMTIRAAAR